MAYESKFVPWKSVLFVFGAWSEYLLNNNLIYHDYLYVKEDIHFLTGAFTHELFKVCSFFFSFFPLMSLLIINVLD